MSVAAGELVTEEEVEDLVSTLTVFIDALDCNINKNTMIHGVPVPWDTTSCRKLCKYHVII